MKTSCLYMILGFSGSELSALCDVDIYILYVLWKHKETLLLAESKGWPGGCS